MLLVTVLARTVARQGGAAPNGLIAAGAQGAGAAGSATHSQPLRRIQSVYHGSDGGLDVSRGRRVEDALQHGGEAVAAQGQLPARRVDGGGHVGGGHGRGRLQRRKRKRKRKRKRQAVVVERSVSMDKDR